jgi:hypothetical protein
MNNIIKCTQLLCLPAPKRLLLLPAPQAQFIAMYRHYSKNKKGLVKVSGARRVPLTLFNYKTPFSFDSLNSSGSVNLFTTNVDLRPKNGAKFEPTAGPQTSLNEYIKTNDSLLTYSHKDNFEDESKLKGFSVQRYIFYSPLKYRRQMRIIMAGAKGVYVLLGARLNMEGQFERIESYVGASYTNAYRRICCYYKKSIYDNRKVTRFVREVGILNFKIIFFKICKLNSINTVYKGATIELEDFFINKLSPSLNVATKSALSDGGSERATHVFFYNEFKTVLLFSFETFSSLINAEMCERSIRKHIKAKSLYLGAFFITTSPLSDVSNQPFCATLEQFKKVVTVARISWKVLLDTKLQKKVYIYNKNKQNLLITLPSQKSLVRIFNYELTTLGKYINSGDIYFFRKFCFAAPRRA